MTTRRAPKRKANDGGVTLIPTSTAKERFFAKPYGKYWRVYDRVVASYPGERPEFGVLPTYADQAECEERAAAIDAAHR